MMRALWSTLWVIGVHSVFTQDLSMLNKSKRSMIRYKIIPDVIPVAPWYMLKARFNGTPVKFGTVMTPFMVKDPPTVDFCGAYAEFSFTICMLDADYPHRDMSSEGQWLHWLVVNVPGKHVNKGLALAEYVGAKPLPSIYSHRQVLLVYKQNHKFSIDDEPRISKNSAENRANFSIFKFTSKYNMGPPIAGNFFLVNYDHHVPLIYQQLGLSFEEENKKYLVR